MNLKTNALCLALTLSGLTACQTVGPQTVSRNLPPASAVVRDEVPRPVYQQGERIAIFAGRALQSTDEANHRLRESRANYDLVVRTYRTGK